ncbi:N-acetylmuramoyl-L-alanine amidase [Arenicella chitinivorans]|nr:N-acetylmuramoyl-L-alanine amidase [Arenicella chitinivorans]
MATAQTDAASELKQVHNIRLWHAPDKTRLVFDVSADVVHRVFTLQAPNRVVIDIEKANLSMALPALDSSNAHVSSIRSGRPRKGVLRIVLDVKKPLEHTSFVLTPNELYGYRLVVDLSDPSVPQIAKDSTHSESIKEPRLDQAQTTQTMTPEPSAEVPTLEPVVLEAQPNQQLVVAIDAGHGGEDPGAIGHRGAREKHVTLEIAKRLKKAIDDDPRMQAVLIRTGDYYIDLHRRRQNARAKGADLFVSIHADAFHKKSANGLSVFALSQSGATSAMAGALAAKENASDLIGGVSLANKDQVLAQVLVDLSMTNTISESVNFGGRVLQELSKVGRLHSKRVEQAGFAVLKSPDMPSILVETGFITNPGEERKLRTARYQQQIADAIHTAIAKYYEQTPYYNNASYAAPRVASNSASSSPVYHQVVRGDTLSTIAQKYGVSVRTLKSLNGLKRDTAVLGARLKLPRSAVDTPVANKPSRSAKPAVHVVRRGDSLSKISARYNVTIRALKQLNGLSKDTLYLGQKLRLPGGLAVRDVISQHKVVRGDTLSEIALKYGSTEKKIMQANNMRNRTVMLGQVLKIPQ